jgi:hypothetical protein
MPSPMQQNLEISTPSNVAQLGGNWNEVWGAQWARDHLVVVRYE